ncbi:MAG: hypothetical protein A2Z97_09275 [Bdellovibrionales bacterium GWB1_52_6]|nr:MAG: hypothetical protein A2Z97_09275 [Bdellovibrionales bacterium GWB1_52_6]OFZ04139.1 MAG: hypothetical protein A2X97_15175 [Bdellovibrionales bacterium GWA1_52_35]HCM40479.1 phosphoribosylglycinamide formyltransferase [Bdellovibrionales bacterium]
MNVPFVFFASGRGSNFDAITAAGSFNIRALVTDRADALVIPKAKKLGIPTHVLPFPVGPAAELESRREQYGNELLSVLKPYAPRFLVLGGFMRILPRAVIQHFISGQGYSRIVNIHPSLLPSFPGRESYTQAFRYGAQVTGVTVHLVDEEMDSGPICAQEAFRIDDCKDETEVQARGLAIEHRLFVTTLQWVLPEKFEIIERKFVMPDQSHVRRICVRPS